MEAMQISLNWLDFAIVAIILLSILTSVIRGFTKESLSLAAWIIAAWVAFNFTESVEPLLRGYIEIPTIRLFVAFVAIFIVVLFLGVFVNYLIFRVFKKSGLRVTDRIVGIFFGLARGVVIITLLVMVGGMTALPQEPWWGDSQLIRYFESIAIYISQFLPEDIVAHIRYH